VHSDVAVIGFAFVFTTAPVITGEWLRRRTGRATHTPSGILARPAAAGDPLSALIAVFREAQAVLAICPRCHLDHDDPCVCAVRRQRLASAVTAAEEVLGGQRDDGAGTASGAAPKTRR